MRFLSRTVPKLWDAIPEKGVLSPKEHQYAMTKATAQKLVTNKRSLNGLPVALNHRPGVFPGKVTGAYVHNDAMYHIGHIDETSSVGAEVAKLIRSGSNRNVSLTHYEPGNGEALNLELSLCTLKGARDGSGIIHVWEDNELPPPGAVQNGEEQMDKEPDVEYEKERQHYMNQLVFASEEIAELSVPQFGQSDQTVTLVMSDSSSPSEAPAAMVVEHQEEKRKCDILEEKLRKFKDENIRPDDAQENETYPVYLMRVFGSGNNTISEALRRRVLEQNIESMENFNQQRASYSAMTNNMLAPVLNKLGARGEQVCSSEELQEAVKRMDTPKLQDIYQQLMLVTASEEMQEKERQRKQQEEIAKQQVAILKAADQESRNNLLARLQALASSSSPRSSQTVNKPIQPPAPALASPQPHRSFGTMPPWQEELERMRATRQRKVEDAQSFLAEQMRRNPRDRPAEVPVEEWNMMRKRVQDNDVVAARNSMDYLAARGLNPQYQNLDPGIKLASQYIPGLQCANEEFIYQNFPADKASLLTNDLNQNLDKAAICAYRYAPSHDPMQMTQYLSSGRHRLVHPSMAQQGNIDYQRSDPLSYQLYDGRTVNGFKNAATTMAKAQQLQRDHHMYSGRY